MIKIGRYGIAFGRTFWIQTRKPTRLWHFLYFWVFWEIKPQDVDLKQVDSKPKFLINNTMEHKGIIYHYCKLGDANK